MKAVRLDRSIIFLMFILVLLVVSLIALVFELRTNPVENIIKDDKLLNVLFIIEKAGAPFCSNIITYYSENKRAAMFDIPPQTGLILHSLTPSRTDRIEASYIEKGREAFRREVENLTDMEIPFYVVISFDDFIKLTDFLSGFNIFIPTPVDVYLGNDTTAEPTLDERILLPSGSVVLDGDKIRSYMTYSEEGDMEGAVSMRRQQALLSFFRSLNDNYDFVFSSEMFPMIESCLISNISGAPLKNLMQELSGIDAERLVPQQMKGSVRIVDGKEMLFPFYDGDLQKEIIRKTLAGFLSENSEELERIYALEILNGTTTQDLARRTSELYQGFGYDVVRVANAPENNVEETVIIDRIEGNSVARVIGQVIHCENIRTAEVSSDDENVDDGTEYLVDFTIILGSDFNGRYVIK